ncbi:phosphoribosylglycinamide formyltransferase, partial [Phenoliferia sp. Uapishka_3]
MAESLSLATLKLDEPRKFRTTVLISGSGSNLGAILAALPTDLSNSIVTHVLSSRPSAYGLTRAKEHNPPIPTSSFSLLAYRKTADKELDPTAVREAYDVDLAARIRKTRPDLVVLAGWMLILSPAFLKDLVRDWDEDDIGKKDPESEAKETSAEEKKRGELTGGDAANDGSANDERPATTTQVIDVDGVSSLATPGASPYASLPARGTPIPIINLHPALPGQFPGAHAIDNAFDAFKEGRITNTGIMIHKVIPELDAGDAIVVKEVPIVAGDTLADLEERIHGVEHIAIVEAVAKVYEQLSNGTWN